MSDTFYGLECLVREKARAIEGEVQRRQRLVHARGPQRRLPFGKRFEGAIKGVVRLCPFPPGRTKGAAADCGFGNRSTMRRLVYGQATSCRRMISSFIFGVRSLK